MSVLALAAGVGEARAQAVSEASFDFYVLSLSWAPTFCADRASGGAECAPGAKLGFVTHGLWPQNVHGYPKDCPSGARRLPRRLLDKARAVYPSEGLAVHEWRTHGACTGLSPSAYIAEVVAARAKIHVPPLFQASTQSQILSPVVAARAFEAVNPGLRPGMFAVVCRRENFEEARFCIAKDLRGFLACPQVAGDACRADVMRVPAPQ